MSKYVETIRSINDLQQWLGKTADAYDRVARIKCEVDTREWDAKMTAKADMCREVLDQLWCLQEQENNRIKDDTECCAAFNRLLERVRNNQPILSPRSNSDL